MDLFLYFTFSLYIHACSFRYHRTLPFLPHQQHVEKKQNNKNERPFVLSFFCSKYVFFSPFGNGMNYCYVFLSHLLLSPYSPSSHPFVRSGPRSQSRRFSTLPDTVAYAFNLFFSSRERVHQHFLPLPTRVDLFYFASSSNVVIFSFFFFYMRVLRVCRPPHLLPPFPPRYGACFHMLSLGTYNT